jgi:gluconate 2-dehydrogenase gamma chain
VLTYRGPVTDSRGKTLIRRRRQTCGVDQSLRAARATLLDRRRFLLQLAGGSVAALFGFSPAARDNTFDPWPTLDAVLRHLLPSEPDAPGASDIHALQYFEFVIGDARIEQQERTFITLGCVWLDQLSRQEYGRAFTALNEKRREQVLRQTAQSEAGENWLSTLITYLLEALLTAPAYGGNTNGIGWRWLGYVPGFPLPQPGNRFTELPL